MLRSILSLGFCFISLAAWAAILTYRDYEQPGWFRQFAQTRLGLFLLFLAGLLVLFSIFFSYSPDSFWH